MQAQVPELQTVFLPPRSDGPIAPDSNRYPYGRVLLVWTVLLLAAACIVLSLRLIDGASTDSLPGNSNACQCDDFTCGQPVHCSTATGQQRCCLHQSFWDESEGCSDDGLSCRHPLMNSVLSSFIAAVLVLLWSIGACCIAGCWTWRRQHQQLQQPQMYAAYRY